MKKEHVIELAEILGLENISKSSGSGGWVKSSCPLASKLHDKGTDHRPSFGMRVGENSRFSCFSCGKSGPLTSLPTLLAFLYNKPYAEARAFVAFHDTVNHDPRKKEDREEENDKALKPIPSSKFNLRRFPLLNGEYRAISEESARLWDLRFDAKEERVIFPIKDEFGRVVGVRGRLRECIGEEGELKYRSYSELRPPEKGSTEENPIRCDPKKYGCWFGQQFELVSGKGLMLVEGEIDAILLRQCGVSNVWASMGASISARQITSLKQAGLPLVLYFDNDKAGHLAKEKINEHCKKKLAIYRITNYYGCKDFSLALEARLHHKVMESIRPFV